MFHLAVFVHGGFDSLVDNVNRNVRLPLTGGATEFIDVEQPADRAYPSVSREIMGDNKGLDAGLVQGAQSVFEARDRQSPSFQF